MPFLALAATLLMVAGPLSGSALADHAVVPAFDDAPYDYEDDRDDQRADPDDRDFNLYDGDEDEEDDSAHGPEDDEGWDIEEYGRSERA